MQMKQHQIEAFDRMQRAPHLHPLTCPHHHGKDDSTRTLRLQEDGRLYCPNCEYRQEYIPVFVKDQLEQVTGKKLWCTFCGESFYEGEMEVYWPGQWKTVHEGNSCPVCGDAESSLQFKLTDPTQFGWPDDYPRESTLEEK